MSNLFDKINTLVNAQVNEWLGRNPKSPLARIKLNAEAAEKDPRRSLQALRKRLEEAVAYEDELEERIESLMGKAEDLDRQVDSLLRSGDAYTARRLQGQLNMKRQQLSIAESELRDHRLLTQHLMRELSALETSLDSQERRASSEAASRRIPVEGASESKGSAIFDAVTDKLEEARAGLENLLKDSPVPQPPQMTRRNEKTDIVVDEAPDPRRPKPRDHDKSVMNARLSRLSRPDDDSEDS